MQTVSLPPSVGRRVLSAALCVVASASLAGAQTRPNCEPGIVRALTPATAGTDWAPYLPDRLIAEHATEIGRGDYAGAIGAVATEAVALAKRSGVSAPDLAKLSARLDQLTQDMHAFADVPADRQPAFLAGTVRPADFQLSQNPVGEYPLFAGTTSQIVVTATMPVNVQRALCWPVIAIDHLLTVVGAKWRAQTVSNLTALAGRWDNFIDGGYSQFPWELALNSHLLRSGDYEPPRVQWLLLHPSIGAEVSGPSAKQLHGRNALVVEGLGLLWYNTAHTRYVGVSGVTTLESSANATIGLYAHLWFPQMAAGYVWRSDPTRERRQAAILSFDLYQFFGRMAPQLKDARDGALGKKLVSLVP